MTKQIVEILLSSWRLLLDASVYVIVGMLAGGLLKVFLRDDFIARHLGRGRFLPVVKAALLGIPLPLCSCGVLPAAAALKEQGANNGATAAFLVSTPESGVDSIAASWALLDPLLTFARPLAALFTAILTGIGENLIAPPQSLASPRKPHVTCGCASGCCGSTAGRDGKLPVSFGGKLREGVRYAFQELWGDLAGWFLAGILLAGAITALLPDDGLSRWLGGGVPAMLLMLAFGIPVYICATASTPVAASLILKGVSPGAVLVFLLTGPATNVASLALLTRLLGRKATLRYLASVCVGSLLCGLLLDWVYLRAGIEAAAVVGAASEWVPMPLQTAGAVVLLLLSLQPIRRAVQRRRRKKEPVEVHCSCIDEAGRRPQIGVSVLSAGKGGGCGCAGHKN